VHVLLGVMPFYVYIFPSDVWFYVITVAFEAKMQHADGLGFVQVQNVLGDASTELTHLCLTV